MSALRRSVTKARPGVAARSFASPPTSVYGRSPAHRRLWTATTDAQRSDVSSIRSANSAQLFTSSPFVLRTRLQPQDILSRTAVSYARHFHSSSQLRQEAKPKEDIKEPRPEDPAAQPDPSAKGPANEQASEEQAKKEGEEQPNEQAKDDKKKADAPPPPPHGDKTPWQVFTETLKSEFKASKEWNESRKQLAGEVNAFTQNETIKKARSAYSQAADVAASKGGAALKTTGRAIGQSAAWTWDTSVVKGVRKGVSATGRGIEKVTRPVRETEAFKSVKETIDDGSSSRYGGWTEKEERRKRRELREMNEIQKTGGKRPTGPVEEDPNAGTNVTLHKDAAWKESWREFRDSSRLMQSLFSVKSIYNESENPLISTARSISDRVAGFFAENETAMVIKKFREMDPNFQLEPFLTEMREYILPEVLDAYVKGDVEVLKLWLSAAQYQVYAALMQQYTAAGLKSDGRILDIRHVDILSARMLEPGDIPVFIITCRTQEVHVYRQAKTGELAAGMDDKVQQVTYAIGVTRIPEDVNNPETRGWRLIELQKSARDYI
ncbi:protein translocase subunit [Coniosporium apollinis]|uniref:Protein translocase subunit n=1 Tax=Coniosporium apollinis TaxID=61459 RepID=A0ABQ9P2T3_9PEZI|nr:protein translocase subunit [Coniosporium apollinis]